MNVMGQDETTQVSRVCMLGLNASLNTLDIGLYIPTNIFSVYEHTIRRLCIDPDTDSIDIASLSLFIHGHRIPYYCIKHRNSKSPITLEIVRHRCTRTRRTTADAATPRPNFGEYSPSCIWPKTSHVSVRIIMKIINFQGVLTGISAKKNYWPPRTAVLPFSICFFDILIQKIFF